MYNIYREGPDGCSEYVTTVSTEEEAEQYIDDVHLLIPGYYFWEEKC